MAGHPACLAIVLTVQCMCTKLAAFLVFLFVPSASSSSSTQMFFVLSSSRLFGKFISFFFPSFFVFCFWVPLQFQSIIQFSFEFIWIFGVFICLLVAVSSVVFVFCFVE